MKIRKNSQGVSVILFVLALASLLLALFSTIGNVFYKLNRTSGELKEYADALNVTFDMGPMISNAYQKALATSSTTPPGCDDKSTATNVGSFYMCFPTANFCSKSVGSYCLAKPYVVSEYKPAPGEHIDVVKLQRKHSPANNKNIVAWFLSPQQAWALPPESWLPDLAVGVLPVVNIASPTCATTSGVDVDCIRCDGPAKNAQCLKVRFCRNDSSTCTQPNEWIEPVFAIQTAYTP